MRNSAALVFASLLLICCVTSRPRPGAELVGEWRYADSKQSCQYVFTKDGAFHGTVSIAGEKVSQFAGRWRVSADQLLYEYTGDALGRIPPGSTDQDKLLAVAPDHFDIEAVDGSHRTYRRVN